ncbi:MAG: DNA alkylation repair protein [Flavobacteriales bacterium]
MKPKEALEELWKLYKPLCNAGEAEKMAAYMKNHFEFLGIKKPIRASVHKVLMRDIVQDSTIDTFEFVELLWNQPEREYHYFAMEFAERRKMFNNIENIEHFEWLITTQSWWDSVDFIATHLVGKYFRIFPSEIEKWIPKWVESPNMWLNRTAIIFQLKYKNDIDTNVLMSAILPHKNSNEFFLRKAIGWALREHSHYDSRFVKNVLTSHQFSGLTVREASKYLQF